MMIKGKKIYIINLLILSIYRARKKATAAEKDMNVIKDDDEFFEQNNNRNRNNINDNSLDKSLNDNNDGNDDNEDDTNNYNYNINNYFNNSNNNINGSNMNVNDDSKTGRSANSEISLIKLESMRNRKDFNSLNRNNYK
jgi:hypothetical protein